jgi:LEA14-like dessication related protein
MLSAMLRVLSLFVLFTSGVGCASLNVQRPSASVAGMHVANVDANGFTMNFDVDVDNPNVVALPLAAADYKLGLAGTDVIDGKIKPGGSVPARGSSRVRVPVTLTYENLLAAQKGIVQSGGNVPFALDAGLTFDTGTPLVGNVRVPLRYQGTLPLRDILNNPDALLRSPAAQKLARQLLGGLLGR